jgi:hypothetical protein
MKKIIVILAFILAIAFAVKLNTYAYTNETDITVNITATYDTGNVVQTPVVADYGTKVSFNGSVTVAEGYTFAYWVVNGTVREDLAFANEFTITGTLNLVAVFHPVGKWAVLFMDTNGKLLKTQYVNNAADADDSGITWPTKLGYTISETKWDGVLTNITENKVFLLQYTLASAATFNLIVNGGDAVSYAYNTAVTINADVDDGGGNVFSHWIEDGVVVSRDLEYTFTMLKNRTFTAVYQAVADANTPEVTISDDFALRTGYQTYMGQLYVPQTYELIEYGFLISNDYSDLSFDTPDVTIVQSNDMKATSNEFVTSFPTGSNVSIRSYLVTKVGGSLVTSYSREINQVEVINNGFETDNLDSWNTYNIWKNESVMMAWQDARVVNDTYFGSNPYDRDGNYNLGIVWDGASWDQSSERMGHLRSSNFILDGSGWISFKIGGGKTTSMAYVSVRRAIDNVEVARFGNRHYNNTTKATAQYGSSISNAEAFMFQYYYDLASLSTVDLGDSLYFVITDSAAFDWCILSADSFYTYYESAPSPIADELASNIVPTINLAGSATNAILNGNPFVSGLTDWTNVNGAFIYSGSTTAARSNINNDGDLGVLRSSAFNINGNQYLRFDWAGGLKYDKQIFLSIKEVGTNIEVLRIVRRDNLSNKESNDFDNHLVDLSGLSTSKEYYVEICDNRTGGWGFISIKNIRLITQAEYNGITSGDRAVIISGLVTDYTYNWN